MEVITSKIIKFTKEELNTLRNAKVIFEEICEEIGEDKTLELLDAKVNGSMVWCAHDIISGIINNVECCVNVSIR